MTTDNSKPMWCPFCGRDDAEVGSDRDSHAVFYSVFCNHCESQGPTDYDRDKAMERWNHRAQEADYE